MSCVVVAWQDTCETCKELVDVSHTLNRPERISVSVRFAVIM